METGVTARGQRGRGVEGEERVEGTRHQDRRKFCDVSERVESNVD